MSAYDEWVKRNPARRASEVDFGTAWTTERNPNETWRVSWNTGSGELVAVTRAGDDVDVLGHFDTAEDVQRAIPDWAQRATRDGALDELRRDLTARERRISTSNPSGPVYGMIIRPDDSTTPLHRPIDRDTITEQFGGAPIDLASVRTDMSDGQRLKMIVDDLGHAKGLPINRIATLMYGTGWPILGDAILYDDKERPLPHSLTDLLDTDPAPVGMAQSKEPRSAAPTKLLDIHTREPTDAMDLS